MVFRTALIAVRDVKRSVNFYCDLFEQKVTLDLGENVTFSGGFTVQENFSGLVGFPEENVTYKAYNLELYFEVDDFDAFLEKLARYPDIKRVHPPKTYPWLQRVIRIFDPDGHIIEIGESMSIIARRLLNEGKTVQETAALIQHPVEFVQALNEGK